MAESGPPPSVTRARRARSARRTADTPASAAPSPADGDRSVRRRVERHDSSGGARRLEGAAAAAVGTPAAAAAAAAAAATPADANIEVSELLPFKRHVRACQIATLRAVVKHQPLYALDDIALRFQKVAEEVALAGYNASRRQTVTTFCNWISKRFDDGEMDDDEQSGGHDAASDEERNRLIADMQTFIKVRAMIKIRLKVILSPAQHALLSSPLLTSRNRALLSRHVLPWQENLDEAARADANSDERKAARRREKDRQIRMAAQHDAVRDAAAERMDRPHVGPRAAPMPRASSHTAADIFERNEARDDDDDHTDDADGAVATGARAPGARAPADGPFAGGSPLGGSPAEHGTPAKPKHNNGA